MKRAIISDIHGNLEALDTVLADIESRGIESVGCLGDVVGYGPNPRECIDRVRQLDWCILGNHDQGALFDPEGFSNHAQKAIFWTRGQLENSPDPDEINQQRWDFLSELPRVMQFDKLLFVHGSVRSPLTEYVFPEDVHNRKKIEKIFALIPNYCFQGHTHVPGVFTEEGPFISASELEGGYLLGEKKAMFNVGSVGQPRDGDPRSSYVEIDEDRVYFHRVPYDVELTIKKIHDEPDLDDFLGDRLRDGK